MDPYLWTLLFATLGRGAAALDAHPQPTPTAQPETARIERLIEAHRGATRGLPMVPVTGPSDRPPQPGCAPANG